MPRYEAVGSCPLSAGKWKMGNGKRAEGSLISSPESWGFAARVDTLVSVWSNAFALRHAIGEFS